MLASKLADIDYSSLWGIKIIYEDVILKFYNLDFIIFLTNYHYHINFITQSSDHLFHNYFGHNKGILKSKQAALSKLLRFLKS